MSEQEWVPHVWENGSRRHVISYHYGHNRAWQVCSEKNCEINKPKVTEEQVFGNDCPRGGCEG